MEHHWKFFLESGARESTSFASTPHWHLDPGGGLDNSDFFEEIKSSDLPFTILVFEKLYFCCQSHLEKEVWAKQFP